MIAKPIGPGLYQLYCASCGCEVDKVSREEFKAICCSGEYSPVLCFECEGVGNVDSVPHQLAGDPPYLLRLGDKWFMVDVWDEATDKLSRFSKMLNALQMSDFG